MAKWLHRYARINGLHTHYVEQGAGPLVVLCHGFPHLWFSWRHQIGPLAGAGWRVVAPDMRGMGQTEAPPDPSAYDCEHTVGDLIALLDHLGEEKAVFVGLDFGAFAIYDLCFRHPQRVAAVIGLENPVTPHDPSISPLAQAKVLGRKHFYHLDYFAQPGLAERALDAAPREFLTRVFHALSGDYHYIDVWKHPPATPYIDALPVAPPFPWSWMSEIEMEFYVCEYSRSGFTGGLNWYRAMDLRWAQRKRFEGTKNPVPFYFIGSENDADLEGFHGTDPLGGIGRAYSDVREIAMVPKAGHMLQMERPQETTALLLRFLSNLVP
ncbi:MAG TPA: alpha/beta hydrolase [Steroidobacteraceae bacterium]|nr:alpha/beta hydrolase [Steroidobacteraceae bacterium]